VLQELVDAAPFFLRGVATTVMYTVLGSLSAGVIAFVLGLMALSRRLGVRGAARTVIEFFRGTSLVVQILWIYFVLPFVGIALEPIAAGTLALALNFGAYGAEIVRGAITAVPKAQWEATVALSMSPVKRMRRVILPQAIPEMVPPFGNLVVQMLKGSSLLFFISITELTFEVQQLRRELGTVQAYAIALVVYFLLAQAFLVLMRLWERRAAARVGRGGAKLTPESAVVNAPSGGGR
jgi:polar amino acid transport system permease protein